MISRSISESLFENVGIGNIAGVIFAISPPEVSKASLAASPISFISFEDSSSSQLFF